ncbi:MAG: hypothetical protein QGD91_12250 [Actinomycetota bacterium]|nr:hypothetical protein [Actinomycetota bacterium]
MLAPKPGLTAAEVIECEFGQFDGWDDAFNLKSYGATLFPASLKATTDPVACETLWLTSYDGGYSEGTTDLCNLVLEYIDVASPEDLVFCGLEAETTPIPTPAPTPAPIDCNNDALVVGDRVKGLYQAKGYPATTYEGLSSEADDDYYGLCAQSSDGYVDIYDFCYGVDAWRYFFDQEAGAQEWLDDCFARKFF